MISFEKAIEIARELNPNINYCSEERFIWIFYDKLNDESPENPPIVVFKREGKNMTLEEFKRGYTYKWNFQREIYLEVADI